MDEDGYVWYEGRADDVIIAAGYRIGPFEVESGVPRARRGRRGGRRRLARRAPRQRRQGVHRARVRATRRRTSSSPTSRSSCASGCPPTRTRARSSSSTSCRRRSPARSAGSSCASRRWNPRSEHAPVQEKGPNALVPVWAARLVGFAALASLGALQWQRMVAGLSSGRGVAVGGRRGRRGAAPSSPATGCHGARRGVGALVVAVLALLAALVVSGSRSTCCGRATGTSWSTG